jgi:hypothetical protein
MPRGNVNVLKYSPELTSRRLLKSVQYVSVFILEGVHPDAEQLPDTQVTGSFGPITPLAAMVVAVHPHPAKLRRHEYLSRTIKAAEEPDVAVLL